MLSDLRAMMRRGPPQTTAGLVRETLRLQLRSGDASGDGVAARLGLGLRTIQRHLQVEGTSFRNLRNQVLGEGAAALLAETDRSVAEIAAALGYEEVNSFRRAFVTWHGVTPTAFRAAANSSGPVRS